MKNKASSVVMPLPSAGQIYGMERPEGNHGDWDTAARSWGGSLYIVFLPSRGDVSTAA
jgi:hypothetical protein